MFLTNVYYPLCNKQIYNISQLKKHLKCDNKSYRSMVRSNLVHKYKLCDINQTKNIRLINHNCSLYDYIKFVLLSTDIIVYNNILFKSKFTFFDEFSFEDIIRYSKKNYITDIYSLKLALLCDIKYKHKHINHLFKKILKICPNYDINENTLTHFEYIAKKCPALYINHVITHSINVNFLDLLSI